MRSDLKENRYEIQNTLQNEVAEARKYRKIVIAEKKKKEERHYIHLVMLLNLGILAHLLMYVAIMVQCYGMKKEV